MNPDILLKKESDGYRLLSGHESLIAALHSKGEAFADVACERGRAKVFRTDSGLQVGKDSRYLPLKDFIFTETD